MPPRETADVEMWVRRWDERDSARMIWLNHWSQISLRFWPDSDDFLRRRPQGAQRTEQVIDSTPWRTLEKSASAFESLMIPRQQKWHRLRPSDSRLHEDTQVRSWLDDVNQALFDSRNRAPSGFYSAMHEVFKSLLAFGNSCLLVDEDPRGNGVRYRYVHIRQVCIETDQWGNVDTILRKYPLSAHAAMQKWGHLWGEDGKRAPEKVRAKLAQNPFETIEFLHIVTPRKNVDPEAFGPASMRWQSLHIAYEDRQLIGEPLGYHEMPYLYSRWTVNPWETYGRGPGMMVLPEAKYLNEAKKVHLRAGHLAIAPPILLHDDGPIGAGQTVPSLLPNALNYGALDSQGRPLIAPFNSGSNVQISEEMMDQERKAMYDAFFLSLFDILAEDRPESQTATEVMARLQEKGELIAPAVGRQQTELLGPEVSRHISVLRRQRRLPPPPSTLRGWEIEYVSPGTAYQRQMEMLGISRTVESMATLIQADPDALLVFDTDAALRGGADVNGVPEKFMRSPEEVAQMKTQRAQVQQQALQTQQMEGQAGAAKDAGAAYRHFTEAAGAPQGATPL